MEINVFIDPAVRLKRLMRLSHLLDLLLYFQMSDLKENFFRFL